MAKIRFWVLVATSTLFVICMSSPRDQPPDGRSIFRWRKSRHSSGASWCVWASEGKKSLQRSLRRTVEPIRALSHAASGALSGRREVREARSALGAFPSDAIFLRMQRTALTLTVSIENSPHFELAVEKVGKGAIVVKVKEKQPTNESLVLALLNVFGQFQGESPPVLLSVKEKIHRGELYREQKWTHRRTIGKYGLRSIQTLPQSFASFLTYLDETGREPVEIQRDPADKPVDNVDDEKACLICFGNEKNTLLEPCGHVEICMTCSKTMSGMATEEKPFKCPFCQSKVNKFCLKFPQDQPPAPKP